MASGHFRGDIAFFRPRPEATQEQYEEYLEALDAWQSAVVDGYTRRKNYRPKVHDMPYEVEQEKERLFRSVTDSSVARLERAKRLDVHYSEEQAKALRAEAWESFLTFWMSRAREAGVSWTEKDLSEAARKEGTEKEDAVVAFVPLEQDVLRLWEKRRRREKPWQDELEAMFRKEQEARSGHHADSGKR